MLLGLTTRDRGFFSSCGVEVPSFVCITRARFLLVSCLDEEEVFWISWVEVRDLDFLRGDGGVLDSVEVWEMVALEDLDLLGEGRSLGFFFLGLFEDVGGKVSLESFALEDFILFDP